MWFFCLHCQIILPALDTIYSDLGGKVTSAALPLAAKYPELIILNYIHMTADRRDFTGGKYKEQGNAIQDLKSPPLPSDFEQGCRDRPGWCGCWWTLVVWWTRNCDEQSSSCTFFRLAVLIKSKRLTACWRSLVKAQCVLLNEPLQSKVNITEFNGSYSQVTPQSIAVIPDGWSEMGTQVPTWQPP